MSEFTTEKSKASTAPHNLEDLLYQFFKLYDNWSLEQKMVGQREAELIKTIEAFDEKIESLDEVKEVIKDSIQKEARTALSVTASTAAAEVKKYCHAELDYLMQDLNRSLSYANSVIPKIQEFEKDYSLRLWTMIVLAVFLIGFAAGTAWTAHNTISVEEFKKKVRFQ
ncbi:MAG TPA: hypothetical protein VNK03_05835 [Gammaproteobacteria bacterium]|nr:hypothetical protein [Gammaproteobacteria bacterium]